MDTSKCSECKCKDPNSPYYSPCAIPDKKGDGKCDIDNMTSGCDYDGGDCDYSFY